jgi:hypothetical protein
MGIRPHENTIDYHLRISRNRKSSFSDFELESIKKKKAKRRALIKKYLYF